MFGFKTDRTDFGNQILEFLGYKTNLEISVDSGNQLLQTKPTVSSVFSTLNFSFRSLHFGMELFSDLWPVSPSPSLFWCSLCWIHIKRESNVLWFFGYWEVSLQQFMICSRFVLVISNHTKCKIPSWEIQTQSLFKTNSSRT